eukprot:12928424-Prorocentrum_lima.AAC.1
MEAINPGTLMKTSSADREQWIDAIRAELSSFADLEHHGWKPKARVVRCGEGTVGGDWKNRADVPG